MLFICRSIRKLVRLNLFADAKTIRERNIQAIEDQIITTRIYLVLLLSSLFVLILFTSLVQTTKSVTVSTPSESEYLRLESAYPNTLTCPCREIAIPYDRFLSINLIYHQVCSSDFISQEWIASLFNRETVYITPLDLRLSISSQFRFLNGMCNNSKLLVDQTRDATIVDKLITAQVLSNDSFNVQVDALVTQFNATLQMYIRPSESFKMVMFTLDQMRVHSAINMDAFTTGIPNITQYSDIWNFYPLNDNASFNNNLENDFGYCDAFHTYTYKAGFYSWGSELRSLESMMTPFPSPIYVVRGMHVGCRPYDAIIISNLQCLFDSICLNSTIPWISTLNQSNWPKQLDKSIPSRFYLNDTIETILEQHMIEEYIIQKNFSEYYSVCNPISCTYTYTGYNDFSYAITMIISLFGGLIVVLRIVSPLIVQLIRYIQSLNQANGSSEQRETRWYMRMVEIIFSMKTQIISLNLFENDISNESVSIRATRIYMTLISLSLIILTFYSSLIVTTRSITISKPSIEQFDNLYNEYSLTLTCPCSQIAIPNNEIISVSSPRYHQVCESELVQPIWLDGYFTMNFENESTKPTLEERDYRIDGLLIFKGVSFLCNWSNNTFSNAITVFNQENFVSSQVLSLSSGTQSGLAYQSFYVNNSWLIRRYSPAPLTLTDCACSVSYDCPTVEGYFYCMNGNNCTIGRVWNVPGMTKSCIDSNTLLNTDLQCFYNQTCFNKILSLYNLDMPTRLPLPNETLSIKILNQSSASNFRATDTIGTLFNSLMVEEWQVESNFEDYYQSCLPLSCTYTYYERLDLFYVIATITGLIGGLMVTFRLIIPIIVRFIHWIIDYCRRNGRINFQSEQENHVTSLWVKMKNNLENINFFKKESSITTEIENVDKMAIIATRWYTIILTCCVFILLLFNGLHQTKVSITINNPSLNQFEQLYQQYSSSLSCPCKQISISYKIFLSVSTRIHQVCSSGFVSSSWTTTLYGYGPTINSYFQLDRPILSKQHQILSWFCFASSQMITSTISQFEQTRLVSATAMSRDSFRSRVTQALNQLIQQNPTLFWRTFQLVNDVLQGSQLVSAFNTDWSIEIGNSSNDYLLRNIPTEYPNSTCTCAVSTLCQRPMRIGPPDLFLPGLIVGCWPIHGLSMSTLECFYSSDCINTILNYLNYFTDINELPPQNFTFPAQLPLQIEPLNNLTSSRFPPDTTIDQIMNQLFIEEYINESSYESYYNACSPTVCRYEYINHNSLLYVITSILSLYGGLTISLRFLIWNFLRVYKYIEYHYNIRRTTSVQPFTIQH